MAFVIKQSYWDNKGKSLVKQLTKNYKPQNNAEKAVDKHRWQCVDQNTSVVVSASNAEVVEVTI